jgi:cell division protein FtsQ
MRFARLLGLVVLLALLTRLPWDGARRRFAVVSHVEVRGLCYLDPERVEAAAAVHRGQDLFSLDLGRARQALLLHPRVAEARVGRSWLRGVRIDVTERLPVLIVRRQVPWEIDSAGVLLQPLQPGVVADLPLLLGADVEDLPAGALVHTDEVRRGLAWVREMSRRDLQLAGAVSEIDVSSERVTALVLTHGTRVLSDAWPEPRRLSALRVVLADLERRGTMAEEVDLRFQDQVIVRPGPFAGPAGAQGKT